MPRSSARSSSSAPGKRELSRETILVVAARLFRAKGYRATSLQEVADHFGIRRPAIYYYFANKVEILVEIHTRLLEALGAQLDDIAARDLPAAEKLAQVLNGQVELYAENISELAVFLENEAELPRDVRLKARREKRRYNDLLEELYQEGMDDGSFVRSDPTIVVFALTGITTWMYRWYDPNGGYSPADIARQFLLVVEHGYLARQADHARPTG